MELVESPVDAWSAIIVAAGKSPYTLGALAILALSYLTSLIIRSSAYRPVARLATFFSCNAAVVALVVSAFFVKPTSPADVTINPPTATDETPPRPPDRLSPRAHAVDLARVRVLAAPTGICPQKTAFDWSDLGTEKSVSCPKQCPTAHITSKTFRLSGLRPQVRYEVTCS